MWSLHRHTINIVDQDRDAISLGVDMRVDDLLARFILGRCDRIHFNSLDQSLGICVSALDRVFGVRMTSR